MKIVLCIGLSFIFLSYLFMLVYNRFLSRAQLIDACENIPVD